MRQGFKTAAMLLPVVLAAATVWFPLLFLLGGSFCGERELMDALGAVFTDGGGYAAPALIPRYFTLRGYVELLLDSPAYFVLFWNSCKLTGCILLGQLLTAVPAAWGLGRYRFFGSRFVMGFYVVLMLMPFQVTMASSYFLFGGLGMLDSHWSILLPGIFSTFPVFLLYRFFKVIPGALMESAEIDGAGPLRLFWSIGIPLGKSGIVCILVLGFLEYWNLIEQPMAFLKTKSLWPLSLYLPQITPGGAGAALAASVVAALPALLVFLFGQNDLERGLLAASLKE